MNDLVVFLRDDIDVLCVFQIRTRQAVDEDADGGAVWQMVLQRLDEVLCNNDLALQVVGEVLAGDLEQYVLHVGTHSNGLVGRQSPGGCGPDQGAD